MDELQPIIVFLGRNFVDCHGICNPICVKLLQLMCAVITQNSMKKEVSISINGWVTANCSVLRPPCCMSSWNLLSYLCQTLTDYDRCYSAQFKKNDVSISNRFPGSTNAAYTDKQTHTDDDSIRRNAMRCISLKKDVSILNRFPEVHKRGTYTHRHTRR